MTCLPLALCLGAALIRASDLLSLSPDTTPGNATFVLEGIVTMPLCGGQNFLLEDASGGAQIFPEPDGEPLKATVGDRVRVVVSPRFHLGQYVRAVSQKIEQLGPGELPSPRTVTIDRIVRGEFDFRRVRFQGTVLDVFEDEIDPDWSYMIVRDATATLVVSCPRATFDLATGRTFANAVVEITGACMRGYNGRRIFLGRRAEIYDTRDVRVLLPAPADIFAAPVLETLAQWSPAEISRLPRRRATGSVLACWDTNNLLLSVDDGRFLKVQLASSSGLPKPGERITAVGYPETDLFRLNLIRATYRLEAGGPAAKPPKPLDLAPDKILAGTTPSGGINVDYFGQLVRLSGIVRNRSIDASGCRKITIESDGRLIPLYTDTLAGRIEAPELGVRLRASGICLIENDLWRPNAVFPKISGIALVIRAPEDIDILSRPSWWTTGRLAAVIAALLAALIGILVWNRLLQRLVDRRGRALYREEVKRAKATLRVDERTRLAVELHDALSQTLTGVALQIDAAERARSKAPDRIGLHLDTARRTLESCREELRNCLWDLRGQSLEIGDVGLAIQQTLKPHIGKTALTVRFRALRSKISDTTMHAVLCIIRELAVNAVRHGQATQIKVAGNADADGLAFSVTDNGCGFNPEDRPGIGSGHFGIHGIEERVAHWNGSLTLQSRPGNGCKATVIMRLAEPRERTRQPVRS